jgi:hypothetical protein
MDTKYYVLNIEDPDDISVLKKGMYVYIFLRSELKYYGRISFIKKDRFHVINGNKLRRYIYATVRTGTQIVVPNIPQNMEILKQYEFSDKIHRLKEKFKDYL